MNQKSRAASIRQAKPGALALGLFLAIALTTGCAHHQPPVALHHEITQPPTVAARTGQEIVVAGQLYHVGAPVVLWCDPGGYDMYNAGPTTLPATRPTQSHRLLRSAPLNEAQLDLVHRDGWTLPLLQQTVDQFVVHYDVDGTSQHCFNTLKARHLGVQLMLDLDGTIYQTMDLQDVAFHATKANGRSVGVEIANVGAYPGDTDMFTTWYATDAAGNVRITIPARHKNATTNPSRSGRVEDPQEEHAGGIRTPNFVGGPARKELVKGIVQGQLYRQYDYTPQQYASLQKLTAALCTVFPKIQCDYPRQKLSLGDPTTQRSNREGDPTTQPSAIAAPNQPGKLIAHTLTDDQYNHYQGVLGHYHVQTDKQDPGPALQWDALIRGARDLMTQEAIANNMAMRNQPAHYDHSNTTTRPTNENYRRRRASATTQSTTRP